MSACARAAATAAPPASPVLSSASGCAMLRSARDEQATVELIREEGLRWRRLQKKKKKEIDQPTSAAFVRIFIQLPPPVRLPHTHTLKPRPSAASCRSLWICSRTCGSSRYADPSRSSAACSRRPRTLRVMSSVDRDTITQPTGGGDSASCSSGIESSSSAAFVTLRSRSELCSMQTVRRSTVAAASTPVASVPIMSSPAMLAHCTGAEVAAATTFSPAGSPAPCTHTRTEAESPTCIATSEKLASSSSDSILSIVLISLASSARSRRYTGRPP
eukprot:6481675-Prymnesium_polylepis.2